MKVRFTPSARSQFFAGLEYIKANNPLAALALLARAKKNLRRLSTYPQSGRKIPEFPELSHREVIVPPYRFFYCVGKPTVWIVAVWHGAQLPASPQAGRRHKAVAADGVAAGKSYRIVKPTRRQPRR